jgi:hypothetical protein
MPRRRYVAPRFERSMRAWQSMIPVRFCFRESRRRRSLCSSKCHPKAVAGWRYRPNAYRSVRHMNSRRPGGTAYRDGIVGRSFCRGTQEPNAVLMPFLCEGRSAALEFLCLRTDLPVGGAEPRWRRKMTTALADDRLPKLARSHRSDDAWPNPLPAGYRFGRIAARPVRAMIGRSVRGARRFFSAIFRIVAEAKLRRLARELSLRSVRYPSIRLEDGRFIADQDRSPFK